MKKLLLTILVVSFVNIALAGKAPKYVFYFIGDGMGLNNICLAESYLAEREGKIQNNFLSFTQFPYLGVATTYCSTRYITDSAAAGTALASGTKTSVGTIGMDTDHSNDLFSVATDAKNKGMAVGIITSVSIDHATPASFFGHQPKRGMYHEISQDAIPTDFDLYGGSGLLKPIKNKVNVYDELAKSGYVRIEGKSELHKANDKSKKYIITERKGVSSQRFAYRIERKDKDLSLPTLLEQSVKYLEKRGGKKGFFVMAEGGMIDWANHNNDAATSVHEVLDFNEAVQVALEFYNKHPKETLIIITSDHETGGLSIGTNARGYNVNLSKIDYQKASLETIEAKLKKMDNWKDVEAYLKSTLSFGDKVQLTDGEIAKLKRTLKDKPKNLAYVAINILNKYIGTGWTTGSHTGSPVGVFAIGVGGENFRGYIDNTDIPNRLRNLIN